jgi:signal transduction histidine kinase
VRSRELPGFIEIVIADTGIGIAPDNQERIFHRFAPAGDVTQHFTSKTKFKGGGVGLGLPIARGIAEAHGGALWVESPGYDEAACPGSAFHVMLPKRAQPPPDKTPKLFELFAGDNWATRLPRGQ